MSSSIYAALEIGTTRTVLAIAERATDNRLKVLTHAEIPSSGVRKSQVLSISDATQSIRSVLREIEQKQNAQGIKLTIADAFLAVSGQHVLATHAEGQAILENGRVGESDIREAIRRAREIPLPKGREVLDIVDQDYILDNMGGIISPRGMSGKILRLNTLQIHADANRLEDARSAAAEAHLEITEPVFAATCAADAVLDETERKNGVLVLDLGGGSTGYAAYADGYLLTTGVLGVGGDHITNDIAHAFQTTNAQAEQVKISAASALVCSVPSEDARVHIQGTSALMENRTISRRALNTVVNARLKELFGIIRATLEEQDILHRLHAGVVLTGGGADLQNIEPLVEQELGLTVRKGRPISLDGFAEEKSPWLFATIAGTLLYAAANVDETSILGDIIGRFFK